jgi:TolB-like protein/DNA-binding winged helix-turn-helix (wHTH) protein
MGTMRLGAIQIDPARNIIANGDASWSIEPKIMDLLVLLASRPGEVMSRDQLIEQVWKVEYGADESLTRAVSLLRKTFREAGHAGEIIETIPKRGYRLTVTPETVRAPPPSLAPSSPAPASAPAAPVDAQPSRADPAPAAAGKRGGGMVVRMAAIAAVLLAGAIVLVGSLTHWGAPQRDRSIAVLPFASESADSERGYLSKVLAGEIIDILSQLKGMEVIARNSSFTFGPDADVRDVGEKLGVAHVLTGVVREEEDKLYLVATLADARTGRVIWTFNDTTRFAPDYVPALQKEIAERVAGAMSIAFNVPASSRLTGGSTRNLEAYNSYLRGLGSWWGGGPWARDAFARATELDPSYAEAWAGLAITTASDSLSIASPEKARELQNAAYAMAERGVKLAPELSVTQACYGALSTTQNQWRQAEVATLKAMEISRGDLPMNHRQNTLSRVGRATESYQLMKEQQASDPLSRLGAFRLLGALPATGRQAELLEIATQEGWFKSDRTITQMYGMMARIHAGQPPSAIRESLQALAQQPDRALADFSAGLLEVMDDPEKARAFLNAAYDDPAFQTSTKWDVVPILAAWLGDDDLVLRVWRDELPIDTMRTIFIWGEAFSSARARPEFKQLAHDIGFVDYWRAYRWADKCRPLSGDDFECS